MSDLPIHPRPDEPHPREGEGGGAAELELPPALLESLRARYGAKAEVPSYVDAVVLTEWAEQLAHGNRSGSSRRRVWWFAGLAAAVACMVWVGTVAIRPAATPATKLLAEGTALSVSAADGYGATDRAKDKSIARSGVSDPAMPGRPAAAKALADQSGGAPRFLAFDADHDGKVNVLDVMRVARTLEAVRLAKAADSGRGDGNRVALAPGVDPAWDLNGDGRVDEQDVKLMMDRVVKRGS